MLIKGIFALGAVTFMVTTLVTAPYGRHARPGWGANAGHATRLGYHGEPVGHLVRSRLLVGLAVTPLIAASLWECHYVYRAYVYPFLIRTSKDKRIPVTVVLSGDFYNMINAYINARYLSQFGDYSGDDPFVRPSFYAGVALFVFGLSMNIHSDLVLINLRKPGDSAYKIPYGGLFKYVSSPNYLSELLEWMGWTLLSQSPAGLSFAVYTAANLVPRALSNHLWYQEKFRGEYPTKRKAFLPFLW